MGGSRGYHYNILMFLLTGNTAGPDAAGASWDENVSLTLVLCRDVPLAGCLVWRRCSVHLMESHKCYTFYRNYIHA